MCGVEFAQDAIPESSGSIRRVWGVLLCPAGPVRIFPCRGVDRFKRVKALIFESVVSELRFVPVAHLRCQVVCWMCGGARLKHISKMRWSVLVWLAFNVCAIGVARVFEGGVPGNASGDRDVGKFN